MTDGHIMINGQGEEIKCFHARDGQGLKLLKEAGSLDYCQRQAKAYTDCAVACLGALPRNPATAAMEQIAYFLAERSC